MHKWMHNVVGYAQSNSESNWMDNRHRRIVSCYSPLEGMESARSVSYTERFSKETQGRYIDNRYRLLSPDNRHGLKYADLCRISDYCFNRNVVLLKFLLGALYQLQR